MNKIIYTIAGLIVLVAVFFVGQSASNNASVQGVSSVGATNSTAKLASITIAPLTIAATSTSILNADATDRAVTSAFAFCTGVTNQPAVNTWTLQAATSSTLVVTPPTSNYAMNLTVATTTTVVLASSTAISNDIFRIWPSGTYMIFASNATNTAACTIGLHYLSL